jgi:hypothetical protein
MVMDELPSGALSGLSSAPVNDAFNALSGYSTNICHYTIGGDVGG